MPHDAFFSADSSLIFFRN
ncbi:hypothetical protein CAEBREN_05801 [Caenorhabditis brenneri]|uniref:Uncharacterized protein n=1 Tax=Caenorhabditis brenneri TaxID=135651 RepID=G0NL01_CAEBE|nr:hypothetical protein CAEBREN_05801 [Caenorhabditis brenneri]